MGGPDMAPHTPNAGVPVQPSGTAAGRRLERSWGSGALHGAPDVPRDLERQPELAPLVVDGDLVTVVGAREPTLRAQAEVLQRHVLRRRLDAPLEIVLLLELGDFRADQPEHHLLSLRHEPERLEAAGAV